jgi:hypothetical protein
MSIITHETNTDDPTSDTRSASPPVSKTHAGHMFYDACSPGSACANNAPQIGACVADQDEDVSYRIEFTFVSQFRVPVQVPVTLFELPLLL